MWLCHNSVTDLTPINIFNSKIVNFGHNFAMSKGSKFPASLQNYRKTTI